MNLLHLDSSILGDTSASRAISAAIVDRLRSLHPHVKIVRRDLAAHPLAHLHLELQGGLVAGEELREYLEADVVVIGAGFYNLTIPSQLKSWIDRIVVPGQTFIYENGAPVGLAPNKRVIVALARGGVYQPGTPLGAFEHAETLLRSVFGFQGISTEFINANGLAMGGEHRRTAIDAALDTAGRLEAEPAVAT